MATAQVEFLLAFARELQRSGLCQKAKAGSFRLTGIEGRMDQDEPEQ